MRAGSGIWLYQFLIIAYLFTLQCQGPDKNNLCMTWFHDQCVGIKKGDIVGWRCCGSCRQMPSNASVMFQSFSNFQAQTTVFTKNMTKQLSDFSSTFSNRLQQLVDRLTALAIQNKGYASDLTASQTDIKNSLSVVKADWDKKSNTLMSKSPGQDQSRAFIQNGMNPKTVHNTILIIWGFKISKSCRTIGSPQIKQKIEVNYPRKPRVINRPRKQTQVLILQKAPCLVIEPGPTFQVTRDQQPLEICQNRKPQKSQPVSALTVSVIK